MKALVYLMLVNFYGADFTVEMAKEFQKSPYDGVAVEITTAYKTGAPPKLEELRPHIAEWKKATSKDIWPWVFINRMVGYVPGGKAHSASSDRPYFRAIKGIDLDGASGAQADYLAIWRAALVAARELGSPGVVCDLEFYNNYTAYRIPELSMQIGKSPEETIRLLKALGGKMADIAGRELPAAKLWFFLTSLGDRSPEGASENPYHRSTAYIVMGLLDRVKEKRMRLQAISGGEAGLGYCQTSVDAMKKKIEKRAANFAPFLKLYGASLQLGGTLGLLREGPCAARSPGEQRPYLEELFRDYPYVWIYASNAGPYKPFNPAGNAPFHAVLQRAVALLHRDARD